LFRIPERIFQTIYRFGNLKESISNIVIRHLAVKTGWNNYSTIWITQFLILMGGKRISSGPLIRTPQKNIVIENLVDNQVLIIMDWAMKFLPISYRETQRNSFGKKEKSWHVSVAVKKEDDSEIEVDSYAWV